MVKFSLKGLQELKAAIARNPRKTVEEAGKFIVRGLAVYRGYIMSNPWTKGRSGGGAPVDTGNLRDTHQTEIDTWKGRIFPTAPYAAYVHGIEGYPRKRSYPLRPWLDHAKDKGESKIEQLQQDMLDAIIRDLAA